MTEKELKKTCNDVRQDVISMLAEAGSGHPGGSLSIVEILVSLYFGGVLNHEPKKPNWAERDRFFLSKAHACPALYSVLARAGYLPVKELNTLRKLGSRLQGHLDRVKLPCLESSAGALGEGLSLGLGAALAAKFDDKKWRTYVLMSDGEQEEGQTMEAMMFAKQHRVDNLTAIIDVNGLQIDDWTIEVMGGSFIKERYEAFGWYVIDIDGHNLEQVIEACQTAKSIHRQPTVILARTVKGKGVSFMENKVGWHGKAPDKKQAKAALEELKKEAKEIEKIKEVI